MVVDPTPRLIGDSLGDLDLKELIIERILYRCKVIHRWIEPAIYDAIGLALDDILNGETVVKVVCSICGCDKRMLCKKCREKECRLCRK